MLKCVETEVSLGELQAKFVGCFRAYQDLVHPIRDIGQEVSYDWAGDGNYTLWKENGREFSAPRGGAHAKFGVR